MNASTQLDPLKPPVTRHKLSVADYYKMGEAGILDEDARVELIEGEIIDMSPIGSVHAGLVDQMAQLLQRSGVKAIVRVQNPLRLDQYSEPEPDIQLLEPRADFYRSAHPRPEDVLLLIEVADTTQDYDRKIKIPLYARHAIAEAWLIDTRAKQIEMYREPGANGYARVVIAKSTDQISPLVFPQLHISPADLFAL